MSSELPRQEQLPFVSEVASDVTPVPITCDYFESEMQQNREIDEPTGSHARHTSKGRGTADSPILDMGV